MLKSSNRAEDAPADHSRSAPGSYPRRDPIRFKPRQICLGLITVAVTLMSVAACSSSSRGGKNNADSTSLTPATTLTEPATASAHDPKPDTVTDSPATEPPPPTTLAPSD